MQITGYTDRLSAAPGETVQFYISSNLPHYRCDIVRLINGDTNPRGPGWREEAIGTDVQGEYDGFLQPIETGSYMRIDDPCEFDPTGGFSATMWIRPTLLAAGRQGLICQWNPNEERGFGLFIDEEGALELLVSTQAGPAHLTAKRAVRENAWQLVGLSVDPIAGRISLIHDYCDFTPGVSAEYEVDTQAGEFEFGKTDPLLLAAGWLTAQSGRTAAQACYNGKISTPRLFATAYPAELLRRHAIGETADVPLFAAWRLDHSPAGREIPDDTGGGLNGVLVNRPTRNVTGHNWRGTFDRPADAPDEYNCIHFHDDDLEDAGWTPSFALDVPTDIRSGVYAAKLTVADNVHDYLPFFVRPPTGEPTAPLAVLMPTVSYLAYANESLSFDAGPIETTMPLRNMDLHKDQYNYLERHRLRSTYDLHRDGSGICYSSALRPILTSLRPYHRCRLFDAPHQLSADLHLIDWLEALGIAYDVITDHDLHREGQSLLGTYRAIVTGTHAEYWTAEMLDALEAYQQEGGRFIYLSGNGLYWVTALDPENQSVCEVRRANGTRSWECAPGEARLSFTGEQGGLWRTRGRPPQLYTGVGMAAQGFDRGVPYRRTASSFDPRAAFIFKGVDDELIGDFPALTMNYGAGGYEVDRADPTLGTPAHALILATATGFSDSYQSVVEESLASTPFTGGLSNPAVRADMVFYETPNQGAVFSVGSISWCSALSYNDYDNNVSRIMRNVVQTFCSQGALPSE